MLDIVLILYGEILSLSLLSPTSNVLENYLKYSRLFPQSKFQIRDRLGIKLVQISFSPQPSVDTEIKDGSYNFLQEYNKLSLAKSLQAKAVF